MAGNLQLKGGKLLLTDGKLALGTACCCNAGCPVLTEVPADYVHPKKVRHSLSWNHTAANNISSDIYNCWHDCQMDYGNQHNTFSQQGSFSLSGSIVAESEQYRDYGAYVNLYETFSKYLKNSTSSQITVEVTDARESICYHLRRAAPSLGFMVYVYVVGSVGTPSTWRLSIHVDWRSPDTASSWSRTTDVYVEVVEQLPATKTLTILEGLDLKLTFNTIFQSPPTAAASYFNYVSTFFPGVAMAQIKIAHDFGVTPEPELKFQVIETGDVTAAEEAEQPLIRYTLNDNIYVSGTRISPTITGTFRMNAQENFETTVGHCRIKLTLSTSKPITGGIIQPYPGTLVSVVTVISTEGSGLCNWQNHCVGFYNADKANDYTWHCQTEYTIRTPSELMEAAAVKATHGFYKYTLTWEGLYRYICTSTVDETVSDVHAVYSYDSEGNELININGEMTSNNGCIYGYNYCAASNQVTPCLGVTATQQYTPYNENIRCKCIAEINTENCANGCPSGGYYGYGSGTAYLNNPLTVTHDYDYSYPNMKASTYTHCCAGRPTLYATTENYEHGPYLSSSIIKYQQTWGSTSYKNITTMPAASGHYTSTLQDGCSSTPPEDPVWLTECTTGTVTAGMCVSTCEALYEDSFDKVINYSVIGVSE